MGGGATLTPPVASGATTATATTTINHHPPPPLNLPVSANSSAPFFWKSGANKPSSFNIGETSTRIESVDRREDGGAAGSFYDSVFRPVPTRTEVEKAISDLQSFMLGFPTPELDMLQQILCLQNPGMLQSIRRGRVYDALRLLQSDPSVKRLVTSISSDKAVWDAILMNDAVRNLQESLYKAKEKRPESSSEEPDLATLIVKWILDITKTKIVELIEQFISLVNMLFQPPDQKKKPVAESTDFDGQVDEKLISSLLLSVVILLIVVVTRVYGA